MKDAELSPEAQARQRESKLARKRMRKLEKLTGAEGEVTERTRSLEKVLAGLAARAAAMTEEEEALTDRLRTLDRRAAALSAKLDQLEHALALAAERKKTPGADGTP